MVPAGRSLAIVGTTGAGKSTIVSLLLRFIEPDAGTIRVGDLPLATIDIADWRHHVAWVPQAPRLFHGTIAENIRLGRPDAAIEDVQRVAAAAHAAAFIEALPNGYATPVGEGGIRLSGGERQRIAIARALLIDAPLLILDEPTAHLDAAAEAAIADTIARLTPRRTVIVITHRTRLAEAADQVVILRDGRVAESALVTAGAGDARGLTRPARIPPPPVEAVP